MSKSLNMVFNTAQGKKVSININNPKENLTKEQVTTVMNSIIAKNIFTMIMVTLAVLQRLILKILIKLP